MRYSWQTTKGWHFLKSCKMFNYFLLTFPYSFSLAGMIIHFCSVSGFELESLSRAGDAFESRLLFVFYFIWCAERSLPLEKQLSAWSPMTASGWTPANWIATLYFTIEGVEHPVPCNPLQKSLETHNTEARACPESYLDLSTICRNGPLLVSHQEGLKCTLNSFLFSKMSFK